MLKFSKAVEELLSGTFILFGYVNFCLPVVRHTFCVFDLYVSVSLHLRRSINGRLVMDRTNDVKCFE